MPDPAGESEQPWQVLHWSRVHVVCFLSQALPLTNDRFAIICPYFGQRPLKRRQARVNTFAPGLGKEMERRPMVGTYIIQPFVVIWSADM